MSSTIKLIKIFLKMCQESLESWSTAQQHWSSSGSELIIEDKHFSILRLLQSSGCRISKWCLESQLEVVRGLFGGTIRTIRLVELLDWTIGSQVSVKLYCTIRGNLKIYLRCWHHITSQQNRNVFPPSLCLPASLNTRVPHFLPRYCDEDTNI